MKNPSLAERQAQLRAALAEQKRKETLEAELKHQSRLDRVVEAEELLNAAQWLRQRLGNMGVRPTVIVEEHYKQQVAKAGWPRKRYDVVNSKLTSYSGWLLSALSDIAIGARQDHRVAKEILSIPCDTAKPALHFMRYGGHAEDDWKTFPSYRNSYYFTTEPFRPQKFSPLRIFREGAVGDSPGEYLSAERLTKIPHLLKTAARYLPWLAEAHAINFAERHEIKQEQ